MILTVRRRCVFRLVDLKQDAVHKDAHSVSRLRWIFRSVPPVHSHRSGVFRAILTRRLSTSLGRRIHDALKRYGLHAFRRRARVRRDDRLHEVAERQTKRANLVPHFQDVPVSTLFANRAVELVVIEYAVGWIGVVLAKDRFPHVVKFVARRADEIIRRQQDVLGEFRVFHAAVRRRRR